MVWLTTLAMAAGGSAETVHRLEAGALIVEIASDTRRLEPQYGPRFDRTAVVTSVRWRGKEYVESRGLCDEFGLRGLGVLGYAEAGEGGEFLKIGVGVLRRDTAEDYTFVRHWPVAESAPVLVEVAGAVLRVRQRLPTRHGYACDYEKSYGVNADGMLEIAYALTNTGAKPITFEQYNHNFFAFAGAAADDRYEIGTDFPLPPPAENRWRVEGQRLRLTEPAPRRGGAVYACEPEAPSASGRVLLRHADGQEVEMTGDFPVARFVVWATAPVICPEVFHRARVAPGETARWTRMYRFLTAP